VLEDAAGREILQERLSVQLAVPVALGRLRVAAEIEISLGLVTVPSDDPGCVEIVSVETFTAPGSSTFWVGQAVTGPALSLPTMR
jgi:hypothetical protein